MGCVNFRPRLRLVCRAVRALSGQTRKPWRTIEDVEVATTQWVDWFNHRRLYEYCGDIPPAELEAAGVG